MLDVTRNTLVKRVGRACLYRSAASLLLKMSSKDAARYKSSEDFGAVERQVAFRVAQFARGVVEARTAEGHSLRKAERDAAQHTDIII